MARVCDLRLGLFDPDDGPLVRQRGGPEAADDPIRGSCPRQAPPRSAANRIRRLVHEYHPLPALLDLSTGSPVVTSPPPPGQAILERFTQVGHCLFALLAAVVGGLIARGFQGTNRGS